MLRAITVSAIRFSARVIAAGAVAVALLSLPASRAQSAATPPAPLPGPDSLKWVPMGLDSLARQAVWHTDFTLDRSMLALAGNLSTLDEPTRQVVAKLNGVAFHLYRFPARASYDPAVADSIRTQYGALGWKHFTTDQARPNGAPAHTDVWLETRGINFAGATILLASPTSLNLIAVSGDISTLDLLRLRGHFGIPDFNGDGLNH